MQPSGRQPPPSRLAVGSRRPVSRKQTAAGAMVTFQIPDGGARPLELITGCLGPVETGVDLVQHGQARGGRKRQAEGWRHENSGVGRVGA